MKYYAVSKKTGAELTHWKYIKREKVNGKYRYYYDDSEATQKAKEKTETNLEELEKIAKEVLSGKFGSGSARIEALTEAGYYYPAIQNKVNELLGSSYRHNTDVDNEEEKKKKKASKSSSTTRSSEKDKYDDEKYDYSMND